MIRTFTLTILLLTSLALHSQGGEKGICHDSLMLQSSENGTYFLQWRIGRTTLPVIATSTGCHVDRLVALNPILRFRDLESCDLILVPFEMSMLDQTFSQQRHTIYYKVKPGETAYGVAKRMLRMPVDSLLKLNHLQDFNLRPGQVLQIGWLRSGNPPQANTDRTTGQPWMHHSGSVIDSALVGAKHDKQYTSQKGVAWWNKSKPDPNLFVLHRQAPVNSLIEIRNPMFGRSVWAKVIGTIPPTYAEDITVIVSQGVARYLGAIDGRFYVEVKYESR